MKYFSLQCQYVVCIAAEEFDLDLTSTCEENVKVANEAGMDFISPFPCPTSLLVTDFPDKAMI